jgi:hypothetical protein
MHCIYKYMPETNHVPRAYNHAFIVWLQFMEKIMIFKMINVLYFCIIIIIPIKRYFKNLSLYLVCIFSVS